MISGGNGVGFDGFDHLVSWLPADISYDSLFAAKIVIGMKYMIFVIGRRRWTDIGGYSNAQTIMTHLVRPWEP